MYVPVFPISRIVYIEVEIDAGLSLIVFWRSLFVGRPILSKISLLATTELFRRKSC